MVDLVALNGMQVNALRDLCNTHFGEYDEPPESAVVVRQTGRRTFGFGESRVTATVYRSWLPIARYDLDTRYAWDDPWVPREVPLSRRERFERWRRTRRG